MTKNMEKYMRITEILSPFSGLKSIPPEILSNACERGTMIHSCCDAIIEGIGSPEIREDWRGYLNSFLLWEKGKKFLKKPPRLYCDTFMITGEIDGIYQDRDIQDRDINILFDLKTPRNEGKTWELQLSAYHYLCDLANIRIDLIQAIKLDKDGKEPKIYDYKINHAGFFECFKVYNKFFKDKNHDDLYLDYL